MAEKQVTDPPNPNKNYQWQREMKQGYKGKPREPGRVLPEGTFTKSSSEIVNILKMHSKDYGQASAKLNHYINSQGKNLQGEDKSRLYDCKEALKSAYGVHTKTTAGSDYPIYTLPMNHNLDDGYLDTGLEPELEEESQEEYVMPDSRDGFVGSAIKRLKGSVSNSLQDPGTRISSVEEATPGPSTADGSDCAFPESRE